MGCIVRKPENQWSFIGWNLVNNRLITDTDPLTICSGIYSPPTYFYVDSFSDDSILLMWESGSSGILPSEIWRSLDGISYSKLDDIVAGIFEYLDTGLTNNTTYYYKVREIGIEPTDFSNAVSQTTLDTTFLVNDNDDFLVNDNDDFLII